MLGRVRYWAFYDNSTVIWRFHNKGWMVIRGAAEFRGMQSHEIGPCPDANIGITNCYGYELHKSRN